MDSPSSAPATAPRAAPAAPSPSERLKARGPLWGLALSGGGIRSATFCFGVVCALARHGVLLRFGALSTVSGGGFIGALLGKLFHDAARAEDVQAALADPDTRWFTWWLRANANYLFSRGARDVYIAGATMLRNLIALHIELAVLALAVAAVLASVDLTVWWTLDRFVWDPGAAQSPLRRLPAWLPTLWLLLPLLVFAAGCSVCAYWALPRRLTIAGLNQRVVAWIAALAVAGTVSWWWAPLSDPKMGLGLPVQLLGAIVVLSLMWAVGLPVALKMRDLAGLVDDDAAVEDRLRHRLTVFSAVMLRWGLVVIGIGLVDRLAFFLAFEREGLFETGALLSLVALLLRVLLPRLGGSSGAAPSWLGNRLLLLAHLAGLALTLLLLTWWMALAYKQIFDVAFGPDGLRLDKGLAVAAAFGGCAAAFLFFTGRNVAFANLSSLHRFFKARLVRGWLGAANAARMPAGSSGEASVLAPRGEEPAIGLALRTEVDEVHTDDDVALRDYDPAARGGPVHLVNACLNHSVRSPRSGGGGSGAGSGTPRTMERAEPAGRAFNPDRKGEALSVAPGGWLRVGSRPWQKMPPEQDALSLGTWTAISGAAFAPGLGTMTKSGIAALAMFAGVRLGCWWDTRPLQPTAPGPRLFVKSALLLRELLGRFGGDRDRHWYLSDGGHFDNSGAFALLRERARLVVLADCGADPLYRFGDLEHLVRIARVELGASIRFLKPDAAFADPLWRRFGSVGELASPSSDACMALAELRYAGNAPGSAPDGWLVLVKPNMFAGLPVDLINYRNANPDFPQQSTSDQGFDEPQWESYFALGRAIGEQLDPRLLDRIAEGGAQGLFKADDGRLLATTGSGKPGERTGGGLRERLASGTVGASIGLTTAVTLGVTTWQAIDTWRTSTTRSAEADDKALKELTDQWGKLRALPKDAGPTARSAQEATTQALAASLLRIGDTLCPGGFDRWFRLPEGQPPSVAWLVLRDTRRACTELDLDDQAGASSCQQLLTISTPGHCMLPETQTAGRASGSDECPPRYWGRSYRVGNVVGNCPREAKDRPSAGPSAIVAAPAPPPAPSSVPASAPSPIAVPASTAASTAAGPSPSPSPSGMGELVRVPVSGRPAVAASAPAPASSTAAPSTVAPPPDLGTCKGRTLYIQVYGSTREGDERALRQAALRAGAKDVPRSEDIAARARLAGRPVPVPVQRDTVRWHTADDMACAVAVARWLPKPPEKQPAPHAEMLARHLKATPKVVEVWLAPPADWLPR